MSKIDNGGPAFSHHNHDGMTLRDYFAAKAMQAIITKEGCTADNVTHVLIGKDPVLDVQMFADQDARRAYIIADAMLAARKEGK